MHILNDSAFNSIVTHDAKNLKDIFSKYGYEIRIVGGAVRDVLMSRPSKDLDFATTASVLQMTEMFAKEHIETLNTNNEKYDTVTACIAGRAFEITAMKVRVPGWTAKEDWIRDAERRDLTINSMFLDFNANVHDHFDGYDDLKKGQVRFIGDAEQSIIEDPLRILRYFRFHCQFAKDPARHDEPILQIIKRHVFGVKGVSGERIWKELKIILQEKSRNVVIKIMMDVGIGPYIGIQKPDLAEFQNVCCKTRDTDIEPASLLASLAGWRADADRLRSRLPLSTEERQLIYFIINNRKNTSNSFLPYLQLIYTERILAKDIVVKYVAKLIQYKGAEELLGALQEIPQFPIDIDMLRDNGVPIGTKFKQKSKYKFVVEKLIEFWYKDDYNSSAEELLMLIPQIFQKYTKI